MDEVRKFSAAQQRRNKRVWIKVPRHATKLVGEHSLSGGYWYAETRSVQDHGKFNTYNNWYCRCPPCTEANRQKCMQTRRNKEVNADG